MGIKIIVKVVFYSTKDVWESFGNNRYMLKLSYPEDEDALGLITAHISRQMGVPSSKVSFRGKDPAKNWVFEVM